MTDYNTLLQDLKNEPKEDFTNNQSVDINTLNQQVNEYMSQHQDNKGPFTVEQTQGNSNNNATPLCNPNNNNNNRCWPKPDPPPRERFSVDNFANITEKSSTDPFTFKPLILAVTFVAAMAWNDTIKFFISRSIKMHSGSPLYYIYYALLMTLVAVLVIKYL